MEKIFNGKMQMTPIVDVGAFHETSLQEPEQTTEQKQTTEPEQTTE